MASFYCTLSFTQNLSWPELRAGCLDLTTTMIHELSDEMAGKCLPIINPCAGGLSRLVGKANAGFLNFEVSRPSRLECR
jgi:hypothetical protein